MTFHHYNRLVSHWHDVRLKNDKGETLFDKQGQPKPLTLAAKSIAQHLAANLRSDGEFANSWYHTGEAIAEELGINRSTAYIAIKHLLSSGVFDCRKINKEGLRAYSLLIECPEDCQDATHYTELEKAARDGLTKPGSLPLVEPIADKQCLVKADSERRIPQTATHLSETDSPNTYRESINKQEKEIDIKTLSSFESNNLDRLQKSYVLLIQKAVARVKNKSAEHSRLADYLLTNPELIMVSALGLIDKHKPDSNEAYLTSIATNSPLELLRAYHEVMNLTDAPRGDLWPEVEENLVRQAAKKIADWDLTDLKTEYNEYLLGSGLVPEDLVADIKSYLDRHLADWGDSQGFDSLAEMVAEFRSLQNGFELLSLTDNKVIFYSDEDLEPPYASAFSGGKTSEKYLAALDLYKKREAYRESFYKRQDDFIKSLGLDPFHDDIDPLLNSDFIKNLEAERASNPELNGDAKHYAALIEAELRALPECQTFDQRLASSEIFEGVIIPRIKAEFQEFWRAYPESSYGFNSTKGRRITALKAYLHTREIYASHDYIMTELNTSLNNNELCVLPFDFLESVNESESPNKLNSGDPGVITISRSPGLVALMASADASPEIPF
jgi:hypothetical protein